MFGRPIHPVSANASCSGLCLGTQFYRQWEKCKQTSVLDGTNTEGHKKKRAWRNKVARLSQQLEELLCLLQIQNITAAINSECHSWNSIDTKRHLINLAFENLEWGFYMNSFNNHNFFSLTDFLSKWRLDLNPSKNTHPSPQTSKC